ncbi:MULTISPECIES: hypothetical protein [Mesorhizobium]|uniref:hypothetical protein n=1 Tax=Mesorhizobium TaxID=68287 RepID=UPI000F755E11|nr:MULTISPECIES: hypothetical protein [Mesorhizobium]AZO41005.1 hypothetical protein EJ076_07615 [Mesorhizobium sp. M7D.F.Ca.US.005.01.1.1]RUX91026.1 hypothetical protein EN993_28580 [Mesorhizobium sp. M7D.F.Ca.US.004.01.2.1]RVA22105.1 hypothetical protein EN935_30525 [Mesorhizobium sp. M7D.F.Ca.US.004.03.1.1]
MHTIVSMGTGDAKSNSTEGEQMWAFDLDALRKAFGKSVQEHKVTAADWAEHAKLFLEKQRDRQRKST